MSSSSDVWLLLDNSQMSAFTGGGWTIADVGPWVGNSSIFSSTPGNIAFSFQGTSISFKGNTPSSTISPTWFLAGIDENTPYNVSFPDAGPTQIYTQWYQTPTLSDGLHNINFSNIAIDFDYALITPGPTTPLSGSTIVVDDKNSEITYTGDGWVTSAAEIVFGGGEVSGLALGNATHRTSNVGDGFEFQFAGSNISVYGFFEWTAMGSISLDFTLDGKTTSSILFVPTGTTTSVLETTQQFFSAANIEAGNHTLLMNVTQATGNQSFVFDYLTYTPSFSFLATKPNFTASITSPSVASSTPSSTSTSHKLNAAAIIGGVSAGVVVALVLATIVLVKFRREQRQKNELGLEKYTYWPSASDLQQPKSDSVQPDFIAQTSAGLKPWNSSASEPSSSSISPMATVHSKALVIDSKNRVVLRPPSSSQSSFGSSRASPPPDMTQAQIEELRRRIDDLTGVPPAYSIGSGEGATTRSSFRKGV
ncbi:hypothetical protein BDP27DRAFT_1253642 [Rhodocollybia butyracea]|uniref:Transmembrane protein n=1 Tax=Rhodocollybia butyracea TaxID=206335 RepID=A0A9P5Q949_9AGAR|nr:hypothetical protein BDP27DRAFT_1253642 [Rhodocollybia butyracea]